MMELSGDQKTEMNVEGLVSHQHICIFANSLHSNPQAAGLIMGLGGDKMF